MWKKVVNITPIIVFVRNGLSSLRHWAIKKSLTEAGKRNYALSGSDCVCWDVCSFFGLMVRADVRFRFETFQMWCVFGCE